MICWGDRLSSLIGEAKDEVRIIAPFIRSSALLRLLEHVDQSVTVAIVTRWRALDVLAGASDLEVFDLTEDRQIPLFLRHDLHAKLFVVDEKCLVGSANVTGTALGWRTPSNFELLVQMERSAAGIAGFLDELMSGTVRATEDHRIHMGKLVDQLASQSNYVLPDTAAADSNLGAIPPDWIPNTMNPDELYLVYCDGQDADVSRSMLPNMLADLAVIGAPPGMSEREFVNWVGASIVQAPLVDGVLNYIASRGSVSETVLMQLLDEVGVDLGSSTPRDKLKALQRWLTHFLPNRYETTAESLMLIRADPVSENRLR